MPGPRHESARLREPPRADMESAPTGNRCRLFCGLYVGRGALTPPRGVGDAAPYSGETRTFLLWQTSAAACGQAALRIVRKKVIPPGTIATLLGPGRPGPRPDESARLREPPRADIESAPTGNRCRPLQWRTAGVHPAKPSFNNNRRPPWKTSPAGGGLLRVNRVYLLILSITANSSGVNVVCSTALMLSRICCVLEAPIRTVVTSSWCSSQARAISARV